jgi:hypothetical protein
MFPRLRRLSRWAVVASVAVLCLAVRSDATRAAMPPASARMKLVPKRVLWAWERPEDLRGIDPRGTGIAYLDQTILLGREVVSQPRRDGLIYPAGTVLIPVVRIDTLPGMRLDQEQQQRVVELILESARRLGIAALQVDFDATRSQRGFYADVLRELRRQMPPGLPLSITALASWCSYDDWIGGLPVDEAVPMFFRMEPDRHRAPRDAEELRVREPLCMESVGVSTHEAWPGREALPGDLAGKRVYVFADRGWREDLSLVSERGVP